MVFAIRNIAIVALLGFLCNCCGCIQDAEFVMGSVQEGAIGPQYQDGLIVNFFASGEAAEYLILARQYMKKPYLPVKGQ